MGIWVDRAVIPGGFSATKLTSCTFPSTIYDNVGGDNVNRHNLVTPAAGAEFNTRYIWNGGVSMNAATFTTEDGEVTNLGDFFDDVTSNGCNTFSCDTPGATNGEPIPAWVHADIVVDALNVADVNNGFFSGSEWSVDVLAKAGMGDNVAVRNPDSNA